MPEMEYEGYQWIYKGCRHIQLTEGDWSIPYDCMFDLMDGAENCKENCSKYEPREDE